MRKVVPLLVAAALLTAPAVVPSATAAKPTGGTGSLQVITSLEIGGNAPSPAFTDTTYDCGNGITGTVRHQLDYSFVVSDIPVGSRCKVVQPAMQSGEGYVAKTTYTPSSSAVKITSPGVTYDVIIAHSISQSVGSLRVITSLEIVGNAPSPAFTDTTYDCGNGITGTVRHQLNYSFVVSDIPVGSRCKVVQPAMQSGEGYVAKTTYTPSSSAVKITSPGVTYDVTIAHRISAA